MGRGDPEPDSQPILGANPFFNSGPRPAQDVAWKWTYLVSMLITVVGGVYALVHKNPDFGRLVSHDYLSDARHCPSGAGPSRRLLGGGDDDFQPSYFLEAAGLCTAVSALGGVAFGVAGLYAMRARPHLAVGLAVGLQVLLPAAAGLALVAAGAGAGSLPLFAVAGGLAFVFYLYREQLALVGRLLSVAGHALVDNPSIIGGSLALQLAGLVVALPLVGALLVAFANGGVVPHPRVASHEGATCLDAEGREVTCCAWQPDGWAIWYMALAGLMLGWTSLLVFTIKVFVIAGITAQWYFAPVRGTPRGALRRALGAALGPSFGSLCLASWLLNLLQMLKSMAENARNDNRDNLCLQLLMSCFEFLISVLEAVTKFSVVRMAITGEALMDACRSTADLLTRNLLDTVGVWWFPGMVLQVTALLMSLLWGGVVFAGSYAYWGGTKVALSSGAVVGVLAFVFALLTSSFINAILLNVVDAAYICFAMDRDAGAVSRRDVHDVYVALPSNKAPGGVVEQPGGTYAYGAAYGAAAAPAAAPVAPPPYPYVPSPGAYPAVPRV